MHGIRVSTDGRVYVADQLNNRVQVFSTSGTFERGVHRALDSAISMAFSIAFSPDTAQEYLYVADAGNGRIHILDRQTLQEVGRFGRIGRYAGQFVFA